MEVLKREHGMESLLKFELPRDASEFSAAYSGMDYKIVLQEFDNYLNLQIKNSPDPDTEEIYATIRDRFQSLLLERDVFIWTKN